MATVKTYMRIMEKYFPLYLAESWDNPGLQLGDEQTEVTKILTALDVTPAVAEQAVQMGAELILTHHPLFFKPVKSLRAGRQPDDIVLQLIRSGISVYSAHTNLDTGANGLNQYLSEQVGLQNIRPLNKRYVEKAVKLEVFVPQSYAEPVREALAASGAGAVGGYSDSFFAVDGISTFKPGPGTHPFQGQPGRLEKAEEVKLETVCWEKDLSGVLAALNRVHPYEEPAVSLLPLQNAFQTYSLGRVGEIAPLPLTDFARRVKEALHLPQVLVTGPKDTVIRKVAVVSGAGIEFMQDAVKKGCQVLLTGDMKYHEAQAAANLNLCVVDAGHQGTEQIVAVLLKNLIEREAAARHFTVEVTALKSPLLIYPC